MHVVLITGLPRSGTSALAAVVHRSGFPMYPPGGDCPPAADLRRFYPLGNCEDAQFRRIVWQMIDGSTRTFPIERGGTCQAWAKFNSHWREQFTATEVEQLDAWWNGRIAAHHNHVGRLTHGIGVKLPAAMYV